MDWVFLVAAGLLEIGFTTFLKEAAGFTKLVPSLFFLLFSLLSFVFLNLAINTIPLGVAYAVWTGIGATGTAIMSMIVFEESMDLWKAFFLANLIGSIIGLKILT